MAGICDGRVVIITGAGGGLGREYALAFAQEGASVVINDINPAAAERTVGEITAKGGKAIPNSNDITSYADAALIVKSAIDAFGDLHVVVNNAGICRDRMFVSLSEQDWDEVIRVHLKGHFTVLQPATRHMREKRYGRIIGFTSTAGLEGSPGQPNYAAAKEGIVGLTRSTALAMAKIFADVLPEGVVNIVLGRGETVGSALINHPKVAMISLTPTQVPSFCLLVESRRRLSPRQ